MAQPDANATAPRSAVGPLSPEHHEQIARARQRRKTLDRAVKFATFHVWSFGILAGLSIPIAIFSPGSLIAAVLLGGLAFNEFRGRSQLLRLDRRGPATLGWNQVICCLLIAGYCGLKLVEAFTGPGTYQQVIEENPELAQMLEPMEQLIHMMTVATYLIVLVVGVGAQGLAAWYYFSRRRVLAEYIEQTPDWVRDLDRVQAEAA